MPASRASSRIASRKATLRVDRLVELLGGALEDHARQGNAEGGIGALERRRGGGGSRDQIGAHSHVLGALAWKDESDGARGRRVTRIGGLSQFVADCGVVARV
jgi:hypothetical protein